MKPRIYRSWYARQGRFVWTHNPEPCGSWGLGVSQEARHAWRQASMWCHTMNRKELLK